MSRRLVIATVALAVAAVWSLLGLIVPSTASGNITTARSTGPVWSTVSAGSEHTCGVRTDHTLWCWGDNSAGQLGLGDFSYRAVPSRVGTGSNWAQVSAGGLYGDYTCAIRTDNTLWCWGDNFAGKLGLGDTRNRAVPRRVGTRSDWAQVSVGSYHTCAVRTNNTLWCWGDNYVGKLGLGDTTTRTAPRRVVGTRSDWAQLSAGSGHTCATRVDHTSWCWGGNGLGQLGLGDTEDRTVPEMVGTRSDWDHVSAGELHTCGVRADHTLWCWGDNGAGQLGLGDFRNRLWPRKV